MVVSRQKLVQKTVAGCKQNIRAESETDVALKIILDSCHLQVILFYQNVNLLL